MEAEMLDAATAAAVKSEMFVTIAKLLAGAAGAAVFGLIVFIFQQRQIRSLQQTLQTIVLRAMAPGADEEKP